MAAQAAAKAAGGRAVFADVNLMKIRPCAACGSCAQKFTCVYDDDAAGLIKKTERAGVVIVAAPVYFTGVPGPLKVFIDRNQVKWEERQGEERLARRSFSEVGKTEGGGKKGIIILTAGHKKARYFRPAESEIRSFFAVNGIRTVLVIRLGGMDEKGGVKKRLPEIIAAVRKALKNG